MRSLDLGSYARNRSPLAEPPEPPEPPGARAEGKKGDVDADADAAFWFGGGDTTDDEVAIDEDAINDGDDDDESSPSASADRDNGRAPPTAPGSRIGRDEASIDSSVVGRPRRNATRSRSRSGPTSPACHPHFRTAPKLNPGSLLDSTKFQRLYFYHARKAGGTSLADYLVRVAHHHGIEFQADEWKEAEEPGRHPVPTLYVAHLREPVDRAISHFKYSGRWHCKKLIHPDTFTPTEDNAKKIETWNQTGGHAPTTCKHRGPGALVLRPSLYLGECAVNCYTQLFAGSKMACPQNNRTAVEQYAAARRRLMSYHMIIILEWLEDPAYAAAVERYFGVPGVTKRRGAFCGRASHKANDAVPLRITDAT
ncbi:hypothetical protein ACHAWF_000846, partial [Thalassiosira exigua]